MLMFLLTFQKFIPIIFQRIFLIYKKIYGLNNFIETIFYRKLIRNKLRDHFNLDVI